MSSFFGGVAVISARKLVLIRLSRLWKSLRSNRIDSGKSSVQTFPTMPQNYPDPRPLSDQTIQTVRGSDQTVQTVSSTLIWSCRIWMGSWSDYEERRQWCQTLWSGWTSLHDPVLDPSRSDLGWLGSRTSSWELSSTVIWLSIKRAVWKVSAGTIDQTSRSSRQ